MVNLLEFAIAGHSIRVIVKQEITLAGSNQQGMTSNTDIGATLA
jgi:hypothetical protein